MIELEERRREGYNGFERVKFSDGGSIGYGSRKDGRGREPGAIEVHYLVLLVGEIMN